MKIKRERKIKEIEIEFPDFHERSRGCLVEVMACSEIACDNCFYARGNHKLVLEKFQAMEKENKYLKRLVVLKDQKIKELEEQAEELEPIEWMICNNADKCPHPSCEGKEKHKQAPSCANSCRSKQGIKGSICIPYKETE